MSKADPAGLDAVKSRTWFYEFDLPDGTRTSTDVPVMVRQIHTARRDKLLTVLRERVGSCADLTAVDLASHEGYFSVELARHFKSVRGYENRLSSIAAARTIADLLEIRNIEYIAADLQSLPFSPDMVADFVLLYGLIYHLENPVFTLRLASQMARRHILIETQVFPYDVSGRLEDGHYTSMRPIEGVFGLAPDYAARREGGSTDIALVPSLNALIFLLKSFGFTDVSVLPSGPDDYEQFHRGSRVVVYGRKPS